MTILWSNSETSLVIARGGWGGGVGRRIALHRLVHCLQQGEWRAFVKQRQVMMQAKALIREGVCWDGRM